jgi:hypothetical protein
MGSTFNPQAYCWRWGEDDSSGTPSTWLAAENSVPTIYQNHGKVRLRYALGDQGGANWTGTVTLQYSEDGSTNWTDLGSSNAWDWADGQATHGSTTTLTLSCADSAGEYVESATNTITVAKNSETDFDFCITTTATTNSTGSYYFRALWDGTSWALAPQPGTIPQINMEAPSSSSSTSSSSSSSSTSSTSSSSISSSSTSSSSSSQALDARYTFSAYDQDTQTLNVVVRGINVESYGI